MNAEPVESPVTTLNAIVFSNFPDSIFNGEILDKLLKHRVHVIQVYKPDRVDAAVADVSKADAVISFVDFMSHPQDELIRKKARAWKKPIASLRRQSSDWPKLLADVMPKPSVAEAAPDNASESLPSHVKQVMNTFMSLTKSGVGEDEILQAVSAISEFKDLAQVEDMFERYVKTASAPVEFQAWWREQQKPKPLPTPPAAIAEPSQPLVLVPVPHASRSRSRRDLLNGKERFNGIGRIFPKKQDSAETPETPTACCSEPVTPFNVATVGDDTWHMMSTPHKLVRDPQEDVTVLKKKLKEAQEMSLLFEEENRSLQTELRSIVDEKVRAEVEQHIHEWTQKIQQLEKDKAALQARVDALSGQVNALSAGQTELLRENEELRKAKTPLQEAVAAVMGGVSSALSTPETDALKKEKTELQASVDVLVDERTALKMLLKQEFERANAMCQMFGKLEVDYKALEKQLADAQQAKERMHGVAKAAEKKLEVAIKQSAQLDADRRQMDQALADASALLEATKAAREAAEKKLAEVQASAGSNSALDTIATSVRTLFKEGFLNRDEIGAKLANHVLGGVK